MKRLLVGGLDRVYEINRNFRNEGISTRHNPEFTMLEFYMAYADFRDMMAFIEEMLVRVAKTVCGTLSLTVEGTQLDLSPPGRGSGSRSRSRRSAASRPGIWPISRASPRPRGERLDKTLEPGLSLGKAMNELFEGLVEPKLVNPTFVTDYPTDISPSPREGPTIRSSRSGSSCSSMEGNSPTPSRSSTIRSTSGRGSRSRPLSARRAMRRLTSWTRISSGRSSTGCPRRGRGDRDRPARHAPHRFPFHPGRHPLPPHAPGEGVTPSTSNSQLRTPGSPSHAPNSELRAPNSPSAVPNSELRTPNFLPLPFPLRVAFRYLAPGRTKPFSLAVLIGTGAASLGLGTLGILLRTLLREDPAAAAFSPRPWFQPS